MIKLQNGVYETSIQFFEATYSYGNYNLRLIINGPISSVKKIFIRYGRKVDVNSFAIECKSDFFQYSSAVQEFQATKTLTYENGDRSPTLFSKEEYEKRLSSLRKQMAEAKLDAVVLTSVHNIAYFSNFVYCAFGRPYALVVTPEKNVTITPLVDAGQPWRDNLSLRP